MTFEHQDSGTREQYDNNNTDWDITKCPHYKGVLIIEATQYKTMNIFIINIYVFDTCTCTRPQNVKPTHSKKAIFSLKCRPPDEI